MADRKITDLTALAAGSQATGDLLTIVDVSEAAATDKNKKITVESLFKGIPSNVGIGTSAPGRQLQINGDSDTQIRVVAAAGGAAGIQFGDANDSVMGGVNFDASDDSLQLRGFNNSERMRIDSSGRLLIGGTASTHSDAQARLQVHSAGATNIVIARNDSTISAGNTIGMLQFYGNDGGTYQQCAYIRCDADLDHANNDKPSRLVFGTTADGASSATERMRIDSSGNVGIGTTSPAYELDVRSSDTTTVNINAGTSNLSRLFFSDTTVARGFLNYDHSSDSLRIGSAGSERMRIDSSGDVGIGTTSNLLANSTRRTLSLNHTGSSAVAFGVNGTREGHIYVDNDEMEISAEDNFMYFTAGSSERMRIDSSGRLLLGTTTEGNGGADNLTIADSGGCGITIRSGTTSFGSIYFSDGTSGGAEYDGWIDYSQNLRYMRFGTAQTERIRITSDGDVLIGQVTTDTPGFGNTTLGAAFENLGADGVAFFASRSGNICAGFNRAQDGAIVQFASAGTVEGSISISGSTTSYNGAHLARWTQLAGNAERIEILRGSVLSNIDEMCEWAYQAQDAVLYTEEDKLPEGVSVGDVKTPAVAAGTEDNEQLNRMKVSDVEGDVNVSGVFQAWDDDDDTYTNDFYCAMTGDFIIRIAQGTTVARGDLLMSAGDGTAKPQDDDIVRSKTIAKVTSTTVSTTYADGSYCVPCVLMAC